MVKPMNPIQANAAASHASAVILSGGSSLRMGQNKAFMPFGGPPLIERVVRVLRPLFGEILISTNTTDDYAALGFRCVPDLLPDTGSLGGIYSGLVAAKQPHVFAVACDMPFLNPALIEFLKRLAPDYDVVIPRSSRGLEPLHAFYAKRCIEPMRRQLEAGDRKIIRFFPEVNVRIVEPAELAHIPNAQDERWLLNLNTPADYDRALKLLGEET